MWSRRSRPWNAPLVLLCYKVAAALAAGCTIVSKPSPETPIDAYILASASRPPACRRASSTWFLPAARSATTSSAIRGVDKIAFTGSTVAGRNIAAAAAERLARVSLELGGKSAAIVLDDAEIGEVLASLVPFSMPITGQVCFSLTRVLVPAARKQELLDAYVDAVQHVNVGDPFEAATQMGPLTMARQLERVQGYIAKGRPRARRWCRAAVGRRHLSAATSSNRRSLPTSIAGMTIAQEEIFGPVVSFISYDDRTMRSPRRTTPSTACTAPSTRRIRTAAIELRGGCDPGSVTVNGMIVDPRCRSAASSSPGIGREGGIEGLDNYFEVKTIYFA